MWASLRPVRGIAASARADSTGERWNHNIHYHRLILAEVPPDACTALDVGCGEGTLCRSLRQRVAHVVGIDLDVASIRLAEQAGGEVEYRLGDFLTESFAPASFDLITSVAVLHHLDPTTALGRMRELLRPGGVLAVVDVARRSAADAPYDDAVGFIAHRLLRMRHGYWQHPSPVAAPTLTHRQLRRLVETELPGARYRQHVLFRYSVIWRKALTGCP